MPPISLLSTMPSPANFAEITLPPGTTLSQFVSLQDSLVTTAITVAVAFGVLICDYIHLFPHEMKLYQTSSKSLWYNPATWAFVLLRYSSILATFPALFLESIQNKYCQAAVVSSQIGVVLVVASSGLIFGFRVTAMWGGHKAIYAVVGVLYVIMLGCWCAVASQYRTETAPPVPFGSNCHMQPLVSWAPIAYASSVAFNAVVLLLAAFKLTHTSVSSLSSAPTDHAISRSTLMYLLITTAANVPTLVIQSLGLSFDHIKATIAPVSLVITTLMAARVYLDLQLSSQQQTPFEFEQCRFPNTSMADSQRDVETYPPPATPRHSTSSDVATPRGGVPKAYEIEFFSLDVPRPDTPFGSYDYDTPKATTHISLPVFTRETVVTVE